MGDKDRLIVFLALARISYMEKEQDDPDSVIVVRFSNFGNAIEFYFDSVTDAYKGFKASNLPNQI